MGFFVKKPIKIEAVQWDGSTESHNRIQELNIDGKRMITSQSDIDGITELIIPTLEGDMKALIGDWIIKGISGEVYPCKPDIFEKTYDPVKD